METEEKDLIIPEPEEKIAVSRDKSSFDMLAWQPKTAMGKKVKNGEITDIEQIFDSGSIIKEAEIVDALLQNMENDLLLIGQAKGKFGGGQRRVFRQTQKKTKEGNKPHFTALAVVGNRNGYVGIGLGKAKETVPAREKAYRNAKLNLIKIMRGCGSWACGCGQSHTVPFKVQGKAGSVEVELMPAPKGSGLVIEKECQKILTLAGITDIWSRSDGNTTTKMNLVFACFNALKNLMQVKINDDTKKKLSICEGKAQNVK